MTFPQSFEYAAWAIALFYVTRTIEYVTEEIRYWKRYS